MFKIILLVFYAISSIAASEKSTHSFNVILTTALVENAHAEKRKKEYITSFNQLEQLGYEKPHIVEGFQPHGPSFLDEYTNAEQIYYYPHNNKNDNNRGKYEGLSLNKALQIFKLKHKYTLKQTGRYERINNKLLEFPQEYPGFDLYIRYFPEEKRLMLAAYIMDNEKMKTMYSSLDYDQMERNWQKSDPNKSSIESYATSYLKQAEQEKKISVYYLPSSKEDFPLGIRLNPENSSTESNPDWQTNY